MRHPADAPQDLLNEVGNRLAALELIFFDRASLSGLNANQLDGIVSLFGDVQSILGEIRPRIALQPDAEAAAHHHQPPAAERTDAGLTNRELAAIRERAGLPAHEAARLKPPSALDADIEIGRDIKLIKSLSYAANRLFLDELTTEGGALELCENVWHFLEQIEAAARRAEDALYAPRPAADAESGPPEPQRRPAARPPSGRVDLTEDAPPEPATKPGDTAGRARA